MKTNSPDLIKSIQYYQNKGRVFTAYEAGCPGFDLYHFLAKHGIECQIVPANKVFRPGNEKKIKTDRRDAVLTARRLKNGEIRGIHIPARQDEPVRDIIRCRGGLVDGLTGTKQRMQKFLLRHGFKYDGNYRTIKHTKRMKEIKFETPLEKDTFEQYMGYIEEPVQRIKRMEIRIETIAKQSEYAAAVQKLRSFGGTGYLTAPAPVCEAGDFGRFPSAGAFMSFLGLVPPEFSSGNKRRRGGITKTGNTHLRKLLTESARHYPRAVTKSGRLAERRTGTSELVIARADKAMRKLHDKYYKMIHQRKNACAAITAVSRMLAGYIWDVMNTGA